MSKKFQLTLSDELSDWLELEAKERGLRPSTFFAVLVGESKKSQENQKNMQAMFDKLKVTTPAEWKMIVETEYQNSKRQALEVDKNDDA